MHDVQIPHERLETAFRSGNVAELAPRMPSLANGGHSLPQESRLGASQHPEEKNLSFEEVREKVQADDKAKWDIVLPRSEVLMRDGKIIFPDCKAYECEDGVVPSPWATSQICGRLNIPTGYFRRCPAYLQDAQFNHWCAKSRRAQRSDALENEDAPAASDYPESNGYCHPEEYFSEEDHQASSHSEPQEYQDGWPRGSGNGHQFKNSIYCGAQKTEQWLLRAKGETLRAVLSDRYTPLDNRMLLDSLFRTLPSNLEVQWLSLDDESFHLRIVDPKLGRDVFPDDRLTAGIHIANSEVGRRSVTVDALVYRMVCSNGLIKLVKGKSLLQQRHVAVSQPHFVALLRQGMAQALSTANAFLSQMERATALPLGDVEAEMKSLMQHYHLSQGFVEQVKASLQRERSDQQQTVFGLTNALTAAAQSLDAEARYGVECLAGRILGRRLMQGGKTTPSVRVPVCSSGDGASENGQEAVPDYSSAQSVVEAAEVLFEAEAVGAAQSEVLEA
jgi:hypothetical protein